MTNASEKKAKSILIEAQDFIEFNVGGTQIKLTPTNIEIKSIKVDIKGSALVDIKGGLVKINTGGAGGGSVIYLDDGFASAPATGRDSKMETLAHEMAHFNSVGGTNDHEYGEDNAKKLAKDDPDDALDNSDNFEYYIEG